MDPITIEQVQAAIDKAVGAALKPVLDAQAELVKNQKILADTAAADAAAKEAAKGKDKKEEVAGLTLDAVNKLVEEKLAAATKAAATSAARQKVADELRAKGVPDELLAAHLPATDDAAALKAAAEKVTARWNELGPKPGDVGGATKDGGKAGADGKAPVANVNLPPGVAKFAASIKLPGAEAPAATAAAK